jgi:D-tyrosyl-tRNA(Tyr) deacylase
MRAVCQRVSEARVTVDGAVVGAIGPGVVVLLGIARGDSGEEAGRLAAKVAALRIFENEDGKFDRSLVDVKGEALVVSQFTLIADTSKGNRPAELCGRRHAGRGRAALRALLFSPGGNSPDGRPRRFRGEDVRAARQRRPRDRRSRLGRRESRACYPANTTFRAVFGVGLRAHFL